MKIVVTRRSANIKYTENIRQLLEFMRHKKLPEQLQKRILCYYEFRYEKNFFREADILESLTGSLKTVSFLLKLKGIFTTISFSGTHSAQLQEISAKRGFPKRATTVPPRQNRFVSQIRSFHDKRCHLSTRYTRILHVFYFNRLSSGVHF